MSTLTAAVMARVELAGLLADVERHVRRYVVLSDDQAAAVTLWQAHTHAIEAAECTPYINARSVAKQSGKTRLLEVSEPIVARPWLTQRVSAAALVRKIDDIKPTLLLDESDTAFKGDKEYAEALRGLLNSGYRRSGRATICVGQGGNISYRDFSTFCPKAIAGIGELPDTVADRSIPIILRRRTRGEHVDRWRERDGWAKAAPLRERFERWAVQAVPMLRTARPALPGELSDRASDVWEPLLAIADAAGGDWPIRARRAAVALMGSVEDTDINVELLHDIHGVFEELNATFVSSTDLAKRLGELDDRPWSDWRQGKPISPRAVADRLKGFGIVPRRNEHGTARGYYRDRFEDAWSRYPLSKVSSRQSPNEDGQIRLTDADSDDPSKTASVRRFRPENTGVLTDGHIDRGDEGEADDAGYYGGA